MTSLRWVVDYWFLALVFALFWSGFYYCLVRRWPLTLVQWRRVDFIWLGMTGLSILFLASDAQNIIAGDAATKEELVQKERRSFLLHIGAEHQFYCDRLAQGPSIVRDAAGPLARQVNEHCDWLRELARQFEVVPADRVRGRWERRLPEATAIEDAMIVRDYDEIRERAAELDAHERELARAQQVEKARWWVQSLRLVAPLLLVIAFALRLVKISGEIRLLEPPTTR
jgi:hypothetical protein